MATITTRPDIYDEPKVNYLNETKGIISWLTTLDHKRIGIMYLIGVLTAFFIGGMSAVLIRTELLYVGQTLPFDDWQNMYNKILTVHGAVMVFLFIIPGIPAAMGNFVLPLQLGAKDVAFPRLNLMSFYLWCFGFIFFVTALLMGGLDTGWTFYTPYSTTTETGGVTWALAGAFILGFSSILTGLNFIATIHILRPPGMTMFRMPLMLWALYATAVIQILATPVLAITLLLAIAERLLGVGIFDPALGGDPVLYQHFFWFYSHPAVYIMILPAMGVVSELIGTMCHKTVFGYRFIAFSSIAIAVLGFLVWGHHMYTSGQSEVLGIIFSLITMSIALPSAVKVFNWLTTMYQGSIDLRTPMWYAMSFIWVFSIGGLTGLPLAAISTDIHLHDTYFVVAHFHYVMVGGTVFAFIGALHYWWPKMVGKMYNERVAFVAWLLFFWGFNQTFFIQFIMGSNGMPRRYSDYAAGTMTEQFQNYHFWSSIGTYIMACGFFLMAGVFLTSLFSGRKAAANPWGGNTLEWHTSSPPPHHNFLTDEAPEVGDPYDYTPYVYDEDTDGYIHKDHIQSASA